MMIEPPTFDERLRSMVRREDWLMAVLETVREIGLPDWIVAAGAIRNAVWDHLHRFDSPTQVGDIDVLYLDESGSLADDALAQELARLQPKYRWEPVNQAVIHVWLKRAFGIEMTPLRSTEEGLATFSETATAVGVRLEADDELTIFAPVGLDDLFALILRENAACPDKALFAKRLATKGFLERWPDLRTVPARVR
ncbi:MAG: nucleotidyltransferase family protein [Actinomycetota bacterium]